MALVLSGYATPRADWDAEFGTGVASQWDDQSGNAFHCTQPTAGKQPTITTNVWGTLPAYRFTNAASKHWLMPAATFTGLTECEVFIAFTLDADPSAGGGGLIKTGARNGGQGSHHPYTDGWIYDDFCSTTRQDLITYLSSRRSFTGTRAHVMNIRSKAGEWAMIVDGQTLRIATTNTFGIGVNLTIGAGDGPPNLAGGFAILGYIGRVFLLSALVSESTRRSIMYDMMNYYGSGFPRTDSYKYSSRVEQRKEGFIRSMSATPAPRSSIRVPTVDLTSGYSPGDALLDTKTVDRWKYSSQQRSTGTGGSLSVPSTSTVTWYRMHGWDTISSTWITWDVSITPDPTGARHPTPGAISVSGAFIINRWQA